MLAALFAEPAPLARYPGRRRDQPAPRQRSAGAYLWAERKLGRIHASVDPETGAAMLLGACSQRATLSAFSGQRVPEAERERLAASLAICLLPDRSQPGHGHR